MDDADINPGDLLTVIYIQCPACHIKRLAVCEDIPKVCPECAAPLVGILDLAATASA